MNMHSFCFKKIPPFSWTSYPTVTIKRQDMGSTVREKHQLLPITSSEKATGNNDCTFMSS